MIISGSNICGSIIIIISSLVSEKQTSTVNNFVQI